MDKVSIKFIIMLICFSCFSCDESVKCDGIKDFGLIKASTVMSSYFVPLENKGEVIYKDSIGNVAIFKIKYRKDTKDDIYEYSYRGCDENKLISKYEDYFLELDCPNKDIYIYFWSFTEFSSDHFVKEKKEKIIVGLNKSSNPLQPSKNGFNNYVFNNIRNSNPIVLDKIDSKLLGKEYKGLLVDNDYNPIRCYLHESVGILAFRDLNNKLWVFDRFE